MIVENTTMVLVLRLLPSFSAGGRKVGGIEGVGGKAERNTCISRACS